MHDGTSRKIRNSVKHIIAQECKVERRLINRNTQFMADHTLTYFDCVDALYTLQHKLHVSLPESNYYKYQTVGGLVKDITRQLKVRSK